MTMSIEQVQKRLLVQMCALVGVAILIVILFEYAPSVLPDDWYMAEHANLNFGILTCMELLTLGMIPFALRLMKLKVVKRYIAEKQEKGFLMAGLLRCDMICLPMILNVLSYYLFMYAAYIYMAIILFLCLFFIFPTMARCKREWEDAEK